MAVRVAAAGGGNWTVGSTWVGGVAPTAADDAQLTVASGNVTIDSGAVARSLDCTGYTGTLTHNAVSLTLGDATAGASNKALTLVAGMTYTLVNTATSQIVFASSSATQQTITTAGKSVGNVNVSGLGSSYLLGDALTMAALATLTLTAGTFNTGNNAMSVGLFVISGASAKTLTLGSSAIAITGNSQAAVNVTGSNITYTANTAVMTFSGLNGGLAGAASGGTNWNGMSVVFAASATQIPAMFNSTVNNLTRIGATNKTSQLIFTGNCTATGTFTVTGDSVTNRVLVAGSPTGTARTVTAAAVSLTNVDFMDITAAGAAGTWTGTSMGNALGNSNITFDTPVTQTHTASAGGNWSDVTKWTSRVPLPQDNVIVDVNTTGTLTADMPRLGADITFSGFAGTLGQTSVATTAYGSLTLGAGMALSGANNLTLAARSAKTITGNGITWTPGVFTITAPGGTYTLTGVLSTNSMSVTNGTFVTAGFALNPGSFAMSGTASTIVDITNSTVTITAASVSWNVVNVATVLIATGSTIVYGASASVRTFGGGGKTYDTLTYTVAGSTGSLTITGSNTFGTINFSDATNARSLLFTAATTTTITNAFNVSGGAARLITIASATAATHNLTKVGGTVSGDYLNITNSLAGGGSYWYAGANSVDGGGNTGWRFKAASQAQADANMFFAFAGAE